MPVSLKLLKTSTFRLAAVYLVVFLLSVGAILGYVYWSTVALLEQQTENTIEAEVQGFAEQYRQRGLNGILDTVRRRSRAEEDSVYLLANQIGRRLAGNLASLPQQAAGNTPGWIEFPYEVDSPRGIRHHQAKAFYTVLEGNFRLVVGRDVEERRKFARIIRGTLFWAIALTLVLGVGGGLLMSRNFLRRIEQINASSRVIMAGNFAERMPMSGADDELDRLSTALNEMLDQIERLMKGMREVSSNVAHDLKTPLTRMRARLEDALRGNGNDHRDALQDTIAEADQLLNTFNALLSIARAEAGQAREGFSQMDLCEMVRDIAELYEPTVEEQGGEFDIAVCDGVDVFADRQLMAQAMTNLLDNAVKYGRDSEQGSIKVAVSVEATDKEIHIVVADHGPGIPEADRERVKERFVRLDESRSEQGSGLGLSLVAGVMKLHNGRFELEDNEPGLKARLVLPRPAQDS
ncbi:MAG: HAMP domain-containing histidine kinase [Rhizobiales bacterium]|nr:HAMP domain-containing histidine kinase [Hyphomicrobiales bacterium]